MNNNETVTPDFNTRQEINHTVPSVANATNFAIPLSRPDRRLLLGASLRVLQDRFSHGRPIFQSDVLRVATLADDAREHAA
jgi:hypothetical protein